MTVHYCRSRLEPTNMAPTPQPGDDSSARHQQLLDQMDIAHLPKPFRNPDWKPHLRRNKNIKQIVSETQRKEASVFASQTQSGATTPFPPTGTNTDGAMTPAEATIKSRPLNIAQAAQSLSTLVLERNLQRAANGQSALGPTVTYTNIESAPSLHPAHLKHYCDITGLPSRYTDPKTRLRYYDKEIFGVLRTLPPGGPDQYLAARGANVVLK